MDAMAAIKETFFQECEEQLAELEAGLLAIVDGNSDPETVNAVFRAVHSIKGGAGAFKLDALVRFAHVFETALDLVRSGRLAPAPEVLKVMLRASDVLADLVRAARDGGQVDAEREASIREELAALAGAAGARAVAWRNRGRHLRGLGLSTPYAVDIAGRCRRRPIRPAIPSSSGSSPIASCTPRPTMPALLLRELGRLGTMHVTCDVSDVPPLAELDPEGAYLSWTIELETESEETAVREIFEFVDGDCTLDVQLAQPSIPELPAEIMEADPVVAAPAARAAKHRRRARRKRRRMR